MPPTRVPKGKASVLPRRLQPRKSPLQSRSQALVEAVVEAGCRVLVEQGYARMSMQRVAKVAGVGPGSLYQYFPDKAALVAAIVERQSARELAFHLERFAAIPAHSTLTQALDTVVRSILDFQRQEGQLMRETLAALEHLGRFNVLERRAADASRFLAGLLHAHAAELPGLDVEVATHVLSNAIHSLTHDGVLKRPPSLDDQRLHHEVMRLMLGYLRL